MRRIHTFLIVNFFAIFLSIVPISYAWSQSLLISEVYFDGTDEWIELTNTSSLDFSGSVTLSGARTSNNILHQTLIIPSGESIVIADDLSSFVQTHNAFLGTNRLSLSDTQPIDIDLLFSGALLDNFSVPAVQVASLNNTQTSFEYISGSILPTTSTRTTNIISGYIANPGVWGTGFLNSLHNSGSTAGSGIIQTGGNATGTVFTGFAPIHRNYTGVCPTSDILSFSEIAPLSTGSSAYIELLAQQSFSGSIWLSGTLLSSNIQIPSIRVYSGQRILLTESMTGLVHTHDVFVVGLGLQQTGTLLLGSNPVLPFDVAGVDMRAGNVHGYYSQNMTGCLRLFDQKYSRSPGFDRRFLPYLHTSVHTVYVQGSGSNTNQQVTTNTSGGACSSGGSSSVTNVQNNGGNTPLNPLPAGTTVDITLVDYNPPGSDTGNERIGLTLSGPPSISMGTGWSLSYDGKTYNFLSNQLQNGQELIIRDNFRFVNSRSVCIDLVYNQQTVGQTCYDPSQNASPYVPGQSTTNVNASLSGIIQSVSPDPRAYNLFIARLLYDPEGSDVGREQIVLMSQENFPIDLGAFRIRINGRRKKIDKTLLPGQTLIIEKTRGLPNTKPACVELIRQEHIFDTKCYDPSTQDQEVLFSGKLYQETGHTIQTGLYGSGISSHAWTTELSNKDRFDIKSTASSPITGIYIQSILPNPKGKDAGAEYITLGNNTNVSISLSGYSFHTSRNVRQLQGAISAKSTLRIKDSLSLHNTVACVFLYHYTKDDPIDTFCYFRPKEGQEKYESLMDIEGLQTEAIAVFKKITLKQTKLDTCVYYKKTVLLCKNNKKVKEKSSNNESKNVLYLRIARAYIRSLEKLIKDEWYALYKHSPIYEYASLYREAIALARKGELYVHHEHISHSLDDLDLWHTLSYNAPSDIGLFERLQSTLSTSESFVLSTIPGNQ